MRSGGRGLMVGLAAAALLRFAPASAAGLDLCNDVLQQDIFNRTSGTSQSSESEKQAYLDSFFSKSADSAYEEYKKAREEQRQSATSVKVEGHYGIIGGAFDLSTEKGSAMSFEDFSKQFKERKDEREQQTSSSSSRDTSLISSYQSAIRDPNTIEAWRQCMLSRTSDPAIVAYGYRDAGGNPYLTVMWLPGRALASLAPEVEISMVSPDPDVMVVGADAPVRLAAGSGTAFVVRFAKPDSPARFNGFAVLVNAVARDGARTLINLQETAAVPPTTGEVPCDLLIQPNRDYGLVIYFPTLQGPADVAKMQSIMVLRIGGPTPGAGGDSREYPSQASFSPEAVAKAIADSKNDPAVVRRFTRPTPASVTLTGSILQFRMEQGRSAPGTMGPPGDARCTMNAAEGSWPSAVADMRFRITRR